ncbi:hypothetical protein R1flu_012858 [Riccia fluitans]|uniref:Uncharacterized protein n=1 Tax=Riccia fluitans TaxID=41844 RepID=A0ABD1ZC48_9MARC
MSSSSFVVVLNRKFSSLVEEDFGASRNQSKRQYVPVNSRRESNSCAWTEGNSNQDERAEEQERQKQGSVERSIFKTISRGRKEDYSVWFRAAGKKLKKKVHLNAEENAGRSGGGTNFIHHARSSSSELHRFPCTPAQEEEAEEEKKKVGGEEEDRYSRPECCLNSSKADRKSRLIGICESSSAAAALELPTCHCFSSRVMSARALCESELEKPPLDFVGSSWRPTGR